MKKQRLRPKRSGALRLSKKIAVLSLFRQRIEKTCPVNFAAEAFKLASGLEKAYVFDVRIRA